MDDKTLKLISLNLNIAVAQTGTMLISRATDAAKIFRMFDTVWAGRYRSIDDENGNGWVLTMAAANEGSTNGMALNSALLVLAGKHAHPAVLDGFMSFLRENRWGAQGNKFGFGDPIKLSNVGYIELVYADVIGEPITPQ